MSTDLSARLLTLLRTSGTRHRLIPHAPEGETVRASLLRGHPLDQAAKCLVLRVALSRRRKRYLTAVVPGNSRVNLDRVAHLCGGVEASFATTEIAERLGGSVVGSITPFSFHPDLGLLVDTALLRHEEIYFNAARLDLSVAVNTEDYLELVNPEIADISTASADSSHALTAVG
jgi:Ala-tRNA(Pro) deacylase